jgi:N-acyl-L-homoserine lactone synthetase
VNESQRREAHQLRYEVYCIERGYEDPSKFPNGLEEDEFDSHSVHSLVRHTSSGMAVGVVRLILPNPLKPESLFPIELNCGHSFDQAVLEDFKFPRTAIAEVSRFAIPNRLIARSGQVSLGLIAMLFVTSAQHQITHWYAVMEPSLSRLLSRSGVNFTPIGPVIDYHGRRQPMIAKVSDLLGTIYHRRYELYKLIEQLGGVPHMGPHRKRNLLTC